jgi:hypothetical protein
VVTSVEIGRDVAKDAFGSLPLLGSLLSLAIHPNSHEQGALPFSPSVFHRRYFLNVINTQQHKRWVALQANKRLELYAFHPTQRMLVPIVSINR